MNKEMLDLLKDIKNLLVAQNQKPQDTEDLKNSDRYKELSHKKEKRIEILNEDEKNTDQNDPKIQDENVLELEDNDHNILKKTRKKYTRIPKHEKDIYHYINSNGEAVGLFYGTNPGKVAIKVAKKIYLNLNKNFFDLKIYNKIKDKYYSYKAEVKDVNKVVRVKGDIIPIFHEIKVIRS